MKKFILVIMLCILSLTACGENTENIETASQANLVQQSEDLNMDKDESVETSVPMSEDAEKNTDTGVEEESNEDIIAASAEAYLSDFDIHPLYAAFLRNEICVENPFVAEDNLTFFDEKDYEPESTFLEPPKSFSLVDVNDDGVAELIFDMKDGVDELMYILGVQNDGLVCYDIFETHTFRMSFTIYDNGCSWWGQNYDGGESVYYTYTDDGKACELIHFVKEESSETDLYYDYYYLDGNEGLKYSLESDEEYEDLAASYRGGDPVWYDCMTFADIPQYESDENS